MLRLFLNAMTDIRVRVGVFSAILTHGIFPGGSPWTLFERTATERRNEIVHSAPLQKDVKQLIENGNKILSDWENQSKIKINNKEVKGTLEDVASHLVAFAKDDRLYASCIKILDELPETQRSAPFVQDARKKIVELQEKSYKTALDKYRKEKNQPARDKKSSSDPSGKQGSPASETEKPEDVWAYFEEGKKKTIPSLVGSIASHRSAFQQLLKLETGAPKILKDALGFSEQSFSLLYDGSIPDGSHKDLQAILVKVLKKLSDADLASSEKARVALYRSYLLMNSLPVASAVERTEIEAIENIAYDAAKSAASAQGSPTLVGIAQAVKAVADLAIYAGHKDIASRTLDNQLSDKRDSIMEEYFKLVTKSYASIGKDILGLIEKRPDSFSDPNTMFFVVISFDKDIPQNVDERKRINEYCDVFGCVSVFPVESQNIDEHFGSEELRDIANYLKITPGTLVLDKSGKLVAVDLHGSALRRRVDPLLNPK